MRHQVPETDPAAAEGRRQVAGVDDGPARRVDEDRTGLHLRKLARPDQVVGRVGERGRQHHEVGLTHRRFRRAPRHHDRHRDLAPPVADRSGRRQERSHLAQRRDGRQRIRARGVGRLRRAAELDHRHVRRAGLSEARQVDEHDGLGARERAAGALREAGIGLEFMDTPARAKLWDHIYSRQLMELRVYAGGRGRPTTRR